MNRFRYLSAAFVALAACTQIARAQLPLPVEQSNLPVAGEIGAPINNKSCVRFEIKTAGRLIR